MFERRELQFPTRYEKACKNDTAKSFSKIFYAAECEKMHREPEVLEAEAQVGEWLDCRARITSKELAPIHSVKNGILQNAGSTSPRMDADLGKSALMRIARQKNSLAKGFFKKKSDKSAVAMLKRHESYYRTGRPVFGRSLIKILRVEF